MVQDNPHRGIWFFDKAPGFVDSGDFPGAIGKIYIAHCDCLCPIELNHLIQHLALAPWLQCKSFVAWVGGIVSNKIGQGAFAGGAKCLLARGKCWLKSNRAVLICVSLVNDSLCFFVAAPFPGLA